MDEPNFTNIETQTLNKLEYSNTQAEKYSQQANENEQFPSGKERSKLFRNEKFPSAAAVTQDIDIEVENSTHADTDSHSVHSRKSGDSAHTESPSHAESPGNDSHPTIAVSDEESEVVKDSEISFAEFPTHLTLRKANERYAANQTGTPGTQAGTGLPFPSHRRKRDLFTSDKFIALDRYVDKTLPEMIRRPIGEIVVHLNKMCRTDLEKVRAYFRWLGTRDIKNLMAPNMDKDHEEAVLKSFFAMQQGHDTKGALLTRIFIDMCQEGNIQHHIIQGKVRTHAKLEMDVEADESVNEWVAVLVEEEWRLIDVYFAALRSTGGGPGTWELIDDNGEGFREMEIAPEGITYELDEDYFLMNPEEIIYHHRPFDNRWQLLARPVTMTEFQEMAFLTPTFFRMSLSISEQKQMVLYSSDGEVELQIGLPQKGRCHFMYQLWRSTEGAVQRMYGGFQLSQFVLMEQREGYLHCKVVFPVAGDYKLELYAHSGRYGESVCYSQVCTYILRCEEARDEWNALPRTKKNEWGYSHAMCDLGLEPVTHHQATIETDDGVVEIKFKCSKKPVDCAVELRGMDGADDKLKRHVLFRQNEDQEIIIYVKLPARGLYALDLYVKWWGKDGAYPHVSTYLIASTTAAYDTQLYPELTNQMAGRTSGTTQSVKFEPTSHETSIFTHKELKELPLVFKCSRRVELSSELYFWPGKNPKNKDKYVFLKRQTRHRTTTFLLRFTKIGVYTFDIYAKQKEKAGTYPHLFTYVIFVKKANPKLAPFPKQFPRWNDGCEIEGLPEADVEAGKSHKVKIKVPEARKVAVVPNGKKKIHLKQDREKAWGGEVKVDEKGPMTVSALFEDGDDYTPLLEYQVKNAEQIKKEKRALALKEKKIKAENERKKNEKEELKKTREETYQAIRKALLMALEERNLKKLRMAILSVEKNHYTRRLGKTYKAAKELKKSLEKIAKLRDMVLQMDQQLMAKIRSYPSPIPNVHATMRAALLLLGSSLRRTKNWKKCQALCNTIELRRRVTYFDVRMVPLDDALNARKILDPISIDEVRVVGAEVATFYVWTLGMAEEVKRLHKRTP